MPIGSHHKEEPFSNNTVQLCAADRLFLFSDGLTDQFGYDEKGEVHKFSSKRLLSLIAGTSAQPLAEQQKSIEDSRLAWRTGPDGTLYEQTDDAIMVCIEV